MQTVTRSVSKGPFPGPLIIESDSSTLPLDEYLAEYLPSLRDELVQHGALLFRGFPVCSVEEFDRAVSAFMNSRLNYTYRSTPRTMLGKEVFTATEYPQTLEIPLHSENAYQREWPMVVAFACMQPATAGGATPISSIRVASSLMGASILDMLTELKIKYVRHYRPYVDLPWQTVFQTESKMDVATFCESHDILHEWLDDETLRTEQVCQGTAMHPVLGERVFFNQAHLFHVSSLGTAAAAPLIEMFGENALPRNAFFGDGSELNADFLRRIRSALQKGIIDIEWQRGDVMILDNMQFAHGRRKFTGDRKILVALGEPHRPC